jgi:hypothetical protein
MQKRYPHVKNVPRTGLYIQYFSFNALCGYARPSIAVPAVVARGADISKPGEPCDLLVCSESTALPSCRADSREHPPVPGFVRLCCVCTQTTTCGKKHFFSRGRARARVSVRVRVRVCVYACVCVYVGLLSLFLS